MYDVTVPVFRQTLTALDGVLDRAIAHCEDAGRDPQALIGARLAADMQPFAFQIAALLNNSVGAVARLRGLPSSRPDLLGDFCAMKAALADAIAALDAVAPADLEGSNTREVVLPNPRGDRAFTGQGYLLMLALPNFFFHAATAYDILRAQGVNLGKRDFLGPLPARRASGPLVTDATR